jgi:DNA-binding NarL/FixJ family response regulator
MTGRPKAVLIVDDNSLLRSALRRFLEQNTDIQVCGEAADGAEAIEKAREFRPGLILMDFSMPALNGLEAAWAIRKVMPDTRIVVFTLYSDMVGQAMAKASGVDLVVSKTEGAAGLLRALHPYLAGCSSPPS